MNYGKTQIQNINQNPVAMQENHVLATIQNIVLFTSVSWPLKGEVNSTHTLPHGIHGGESLYFLF
jgi:hypothetical protein